MNFIAVIKVDKAALLGKRLASVRQAFGKVQCAVLNSAAFHNLQRMALSARNQSNR